MNTDLRALPVLPRLLARAGARPGAAFGVLYIVWALPFLACLAWLTPPWQNPDEPLHFARAVHVAHGGFVGWRQFGTTGGLSDRAIYRAYAPLQHAAMQPQQHLTGSDIARSAAVKWDTPLYASFPNTAQYPPFFYIPDALAYWAGRAMRLHIDRTLLLARLANAALFVSLAGLALALARRTRPMLLAMLMLPTTLSLACSASQDALAQGATALAVALLDREADGAAPFRWQRELVTVLLMLVAMARPPYIGFLAVCGMGYAPWRGRARRGLALAAAAVAAWCVLVAVHTSVPFGGADAARQMRMLAADSLSIPIILWRTLHDFTIEWWVQVIGVLGWTDTRLPSAYIGFASVTLLCAFASAATPAPRGAWRAPAAFGFVLASILVLQYLTWTWPGQPVVTGILGRYFTMPLMVLALGAPCLGRAGLLARHACPALLAILALATPAITLHAILWRYYIP